MDVPVVVALTVEDDATFAYSHTSSDPYAEIDDVNVNDRVVAVATLVQIPNSSLPGRLSCEELTKPAGAERDCPLGLFAEYPATRKSPTDTPLFSVAVRLATLFDDCALAHGWTRLMTLVTDAALAAFVSKQSNAKTTNAKRIYANPASMSPSLISMR